MSTDVARTNPREESNDRATLLLEPDLKRPSRVDNATADRPTLPFRQPGELPFVCAGGNRSPLYLAARRVIDVVGAVAALVLFSPVMLFSLVVLWATTRGRPIFRQERIGFCGRPFTMYKFRTMWLDAEAHKHLVKNERQGPVFKNRSDPRITRFGRLLRTYSIDEMPQLFNVLKGDMSLVGPRPPIRAEVLQYTPEQFERLSVNPGLTCLWQVSGRAELDFEQQVRLDVAYVRNQSLLSDLVLLIRTPLSVLSRRGAY